jgi:hypothetical protein
MTREVSLSELDDVLAEFDYPVARETVVAEGSDVVLLLADGTKPLADVVEGSSVETFDAADELSNEVMGLLPRRAVGEPYQSEGEG